MNPASAQVCQKGAQSRPRPFTDISGDGALIKLGEVLKSRLYRFTTVTPATHERVNRRPGSEWATNLEGIFGWNRPFHASVIPVDILELMHEANAVLTDTEGWHSMLRVSTLGNNLFFHSAYPTKEEDAVFFGPDTYRFVAAVDAHLDERSTPVRRAVDIGCGAGPGAIGMAIRYPQAEVLAVDINSKALRATSINASLASAHNITTHYSDLLNDTAGTFDLIIANPPYMVDPVGRAYRHGGGLLGAGLSLAIVDAAVHRLRPGGSLVLYTGVAIVEGVDPFHLVIEEKLLDRKFRWSYREIDPDVFGEELSGAVYSGVDRIAAVVLTVTLDH
jgi:methylase of polypeptide subunit release factors